MTALFPPGRRATALGLVTAGGFVSMVFLNMLGPVLVVPLGWSNLFMVLAVGGLLLAIVYWRFGAPGPAGSGKEPMPFQQMIVLFRCRIMWVIGGIQYVRLAVVMGIGFSLPSFIVLEKGYSLQVAAPLVAFGALLTAPSNILGGYISDRLRNPLTVIGTALAVLALTTLSLLHVHDILLLTAAIGINGIFRQIYFGPLFAVPVQILGPKAGRPARPASATSSRTWAVSRSRTRSDCRGTSPDPSTSAFTRSLFCAWSASR